MKNKLLFILALLLVLPVVFAQTTELINLINSYHSASEKADAQATISLLYYPEGTADWFIEDEKENIKSKFASKQLKGVEFDFVKEEFFNSGKNAYVEILITAGEVYYPDKGTSTTLSKDNVFFVFEKQNNKWKILNYSVSSSDFSDSQKEEYVAVFKEAFFASIEEQKGFDPTPPGDGNKSDQNALVGLLDSLIGLVSIAIVIVILLILFFSLTGKGKNKSEDQTIVVNVQAPVSQPTETQTIKKATEQAQTTMTKKEYSDAMKILRKRYASGEINKQQFDEMKKELEG